MKKKYIKEVKQYGFGGDFGPESYDAFYDDNEVFKTIYKIFKESDGYFSKQSSLYKDAKEFSEVIFDYIINNYGEIPKKEKLTNFIENMLDNDSKFFNNIMLPVLN